MGGQGAGPLPGHTPLILCPPPTPHPTPPHPLQAQGEWTAEEHALFLATARAQGAGDKWGLFASHIPQRVGYQCSAYYRDVMLPQGLIIDPRFKISRGGRAHYVG